MGKSKTIINMRTMQFKYVKEKTKGTRQLYFILKHMKCRPNPPEGEKAV